MLLTRLYYGNQENFQNIKWAILVAVFAVGGPVGSGVLAEGQREEVGLWFATDPRGEGCFSGGVLWEGKC